MTTTPRVHPLDRVIGADWPDLSTPDAVRRFEAVPYEQRIAARSTYEALQVGAAVNPAAPAIQFLANADPDETPVVYTHAAFVERVTQVANMLASLGVTKNDTVSFLLPLLPQSLATLFGAEAAGIANPVNPLLEPHQVVEILRAADTKVLVTLGPMPGTDIWDKVQKIRGELPELTAIVVVGGSATGVVTPAGSSRAGTPVHDFDALADAQPGDRLVHREQIASDETAAYFHTGGTTGTPKLVRHTHGNQVYQGWTVGLMLRIRPGETMLFGLPLFHVGGALTQALAVLSCGGSLVVVSPAGWRSPAAVRNVWKLVARYRPRALCAVPTVLTAALGVPVDGADISSLAVAAGGGSAIPVAIAKTYTEKFKLPVQEVYGMTETSSVHTISYIDRPIRLGTVGHPVPYARVKIVKIDADGKYLGDCAPGEIGVVAMAGPGVFSGYRSAAHNREAFVEPGWVNSGDLGRIDDDGYIWITGRAKDLVIRGGHNIDPMAIEEVFYTHPAVALAAVVGQPDAYAGELPVAYVQKKPGVDVDANELLAYVRERTPERAAVPVALHWIETMPQTAVGKVFKPALRWDSARRVAERMLADAPLAGGSVSVTAGSHPVHGSLITVAVSGVAPGERAGVEHTVQERLGPLTTRHEIVWQ